MSDRKKLKYTITRAVMDQLPHTYSTSIDDIISQWWFTKSGDSLRLSAVGDAAFRLATIEFFESPVKVKHLNWYKFLTECNKKIKCPYYFSASTEGDSKVKQPFIRVYDSKIAMMLALYGDIESYLESVRVRS